MTGTILHLGSIVLVIVVAIGAPAIVAAIVGVAVTFVVRILAVVFHWSLPEQRPLRRGTRGTPGTAA